jgi:hypothetical protein
LKIFGQIEDVSLEQLASDPVASTQGRVWENTTTGRIMHDSGTQKRAVLKNDQKNIIGNSATAAENIRVHRGGAQLIQDVLGSDVTAEGTSSTSIAQRSSRLENKVAASLPAVGNAGRGIFVTDQNVVAVDDGAAWRKVIPELAANDATSGATISLAAVTSSVVRLTGSFSTVEMIPAGFDSQHVTLINRTGTDVVVSNESGATPENRILTGTNANLVLKSNSALTLKYDITTDRWQVIGQAAGAGAGGGGVPNSAIQTVTSVYTVLVTDDVILADTSDGEVTLTLPTASGNLGKRIVLEKIAGRQNNAVNIIGTVDGVVDPVLLAVGSFVEILSDGSDWKTISAANGVLEYSSLPSPNAQSLVVLVGAVSTANVSLETLSAASATVIDNIVVKTGTVVLLKNQSAPEEDGLYTVPATNIVIAATAVANEDISLLADTSVVNATVVSTGQLVSLRFQSISSENGIYVIGATAGTTVRDTSMRRVNFTTPADFKDLLMFATWYNFPSGSVALSPTESSASHTNDMRFWRQTNDNLTTFTDAVYSTANITRTVTVPLRAKEVEFEITPFGGAGAGGTNSRGGSGGSGALPFTFKRSVIPGETIALTLPLGSVPGSGRTVGVSGAAIASAMSVVFSSGQPTISIANAAGGPSTGLAGTTTPSNAGGPLFSTSGASAAVGGLTYFAAGGTAGGGGAMGGGGGGAGIGRGGQGGTGSSAANYLGNPGGLYTGAPISMWGSGGGGAGGGPASGRPGRGGFAAPGLIRMKWG